MWKFTSVYKNKELFYKPIWGDEREGEWRKRKMDRSMLTDFMTNLLTERYDQQIKRQTDKYADINRKKETNKKKKDRERHG